VWFVDVVSVEFDRRALRADFRAAIPAICQDAAFAQASAAGFWWRVHGLEINVGIDLIVGSRWK
jgi:hypothetical protein